MFREVVFLAFLVFQFIHASKHKFGDLPAAIKGFYPQDHKDLIKNLTADDKAVLKEVFGKNTTFKSGEEAIAELQKKSPKLGATAEKIRAVIMGKVAALKLQETKDFVQQMLAKGRKMRARIFSDNKPSLADLQKAVTELVQSYKALSDAGKSDFEKQFPELTKHLRSEEVAKFTGVKL
ncbi:hypothetical protein RB195_019813 [Necator americanus]|uniref:Fatty-acid and retinol-binding protein 1 n=1 Tax=Necator americanus TaxID=51031 RepID=A0ABR1CHH7_NECAM